MNIGIDHGYYAIKTRHCSFPAGLTAYGSHEPYTRQGLLESGGCFFVCGTGRQPIQRDKTINDNYYLLTLAALGQEIRSRGAPTECTIRIAAGLPLTSYGRDKPKFRSYLLRPSQPVQFRYEGVEYSITIADVQLFPQGFAALMAEPDLLTDEPSLLLMDIGGWTVDLMRIDNALPVAETAHSLELGMIRCIDEIRERVRQETGLSLTDAQIEQILAGQPCSLSDEVRSIESPIVLQHTFEILPQLFCYPFAFISRLKVNAQIRFKYSRVVVFFISIKDICYCCVLSKTLFVVIYVSTSIDSCLVILFIWCSRFSYSFTYSHIKCDCLVWYTNKYCRMRMRQP